MQLTLGRACIQVRKGQFKCRAIPMNMSNQRLHWVIKSKWTRAWKDEVQASLMLIKKPPGLPLEKANIKITLHVCHLMDHDGAYSAIKPVLDALTEQKIIIDDSPKYIELKVEQKKVAHKTEEKTEILIL